MRLLALALAAILPAGSAAAPLVVTPDQPPAADPAWGQAIPGTASEKTCRRTDLHPAQRDGKVRFRKLDELPDGTAFMAVYRLVDGCEVPLTVVDYRRDSGR